MDTSAFPLHLDGLCKGHHRELGDPLERPISVAWLLARDHRVERRAALFTLDRFHSDTEDVHLQPTKLIWLKYSSALQALDTRYEPHKRYIRISFGKNILLSLCTY